MNTQRHPDFIKLKHKIQNCDKPEQLERLRQVIIRYGHEHADRAELMAYFLEKEYDLNPEHKNERIETMCNISQQPIATESMADETSMESIQDKRLEE